MLCGCIVKTLIIAAEFLIISHYNIIKRSDFDLVSSM